RARGVEPDKYLHGLGAREMAVAEPGEDTVALAALAARRALDAGAVNRADLGLLIVGTETGVDHSKPVASFVHGLLQLPSAMRVYDTQHACYGGTAGVMAAVEWIASGAADGRAALVVCSDIARYGVATAHVPFCKMARKAHVQVRRCDAEDAGTAWDAAAEERAAASFADQVEPSLGLCARVGNIYTGSLYLGLAGLLHAQAPALVGERIGLFSYGSGCTSEFFSAVVGRRAAEQIAAANIAELLAARERISIAEYERLMALPAN